MRPEAHRTRTSSVPEHCTPARREFRSRGRAIGQRDAKRVSKHTADQAAPSARLLETRAPTGAEALLETGAPTQTQVVWLTLDPSLFPVPT